MIKILLIGLSKNFGGIETYIYNLVKYSDKEKFSFDILCAEKEKLALEDEMISFGCKILKVTPRKENYKKHIQELREIFEKVDYDYFHYNAMSYSWCEPILIANKYSKAQIILHTHTAGFDRKNGFKSRILHELGCFRIKKIPYLRAACGELAGKFMFKEKGFAIFNNGIELEKFKFNKEHRLEIRNELKLSDDITVIGLIARLEAEKNILFLIDVFYEIIKQKNNVKLVLVGDGSLKDAICEQIEKYNIKDKVVLMGRRKDAYKIYSAFDIFLMPSIYEGWGISLTEAQVNGLKCYASNTIDSKVDITGNVKFISLEESAKEWSNKILKGNNQRDEKVLNNISEEIDVKKSYEKVYKFYEENMKR